MILFLLIPPPNRPSSVPADVRGMHIFDVSAHAFSLRWEQSAGCVDHYLVKLQPDKGEVRMRPARDGSIQVHKRENTPFLEFCLDSLLHLCQ